MRQMKDYSFIHSRLWIDDAFLGMSPEQKLIMIYILTNPYSSWCGIYKLPMTTMANQLGLKERPTESSFSSFVFQYKDLIAFDASTGEVAILNWAKLNLKEANAIAIKKAKSDVSEVKSLDLLNAMVAATDSSRLKDIYLTAARALRAKRLSENDEQKNEGILRQPLQLVENQEVLSKVNESKIKSNEREKDLEKESLFFGGENPDGTPVAKSSKKKNGAVSPAPGGFDSFINPAMAAEIWDEWLAHKKGRGESYKTSISMAHGIAKLRNYSDGSIMKARAIIHDAIGNNYAGFFPFKDSMLASVVMTEATGIPKMPVDDHELSPELENRYSLTTSWFFKNCPLCHSMRWLNKREFEAVVNKDTSFIGAMWYAHCVADKYTYHVTESLKSLNAAPRWEKEAVATVFDWLKKDVRDRIFGKKNA